jgi:hypothetical protein
MLPRLRDWERSVTGLVASSASLETAAASAAVAASTDFFGSLDLERADLVAAAAEPRAGLANVALAVDHRCFHKILL